MTGTVTGFSIAKNRDGTKDVVMLSVRFSDPEDIQTVEWMTPAGDDSIPPLGAMVTVLEVSPEYRIAIACRDAIDRNADEGEKILYSQANSAIKAFIHLFSDSKIEINGTVEIKLVTGDAVTWKPNILEIDPFTGLPHGGPGAGIAKLIGG